MEYKYGKIDIENNKYEIKKYSFEEKLKIIIDIMDEYFDYWYEYKDDKFHFVDRVYKHWKYLKMPHWFDIEKCKKCKILYTEKINDNYCKNDCCDFIMKSRLIDNTYELFFDNLIDIINWIIDNSCKEKSYYNLLKSFIEENNHE